MFFSLKNIQLAVQHPLKVTPALLNCFDVRDVMTGNHKAGTQTHGSETKQASKNTMSLLGKIARHTGRQSGGTLLRRTKTNWHRGQGDNSTQVQHIRAGQAITGAGNTRGQEV